MASSPRSTWTGAITHDLLVIPVTIGKAVTETREKSLKNLCTCHGLPIDSRHRCRETGELGPDTIKGVDMGDGTYRKLSESEYVAIEEATKDERLEILDVQPLGQLPLVFSTGTYYVRATKSDRASAGSVAALTAGLAQTGYGAVVKLCKAARQDLAVLHCYQGYLLLSVVPMVDAFVRPGDLERAHMKVEVAESTVGKVAALLEEIRSPAGFQYAAYTDNGLKMRQEVVDRVLAGAEIKAAAKTAVKSEGAEFVDNIERMLAQKTKTKAASEQPERMAA